MTDPPRLDRAALLTRKHPTPPSLLVDLAVVLAVDREGRERRHPLVPRLRGVVRSRGQKAAFAAFWARENEHARAGDGPLWVALGDSTAQGIGADDPTQGYVARVRDRLAGDGWRVLNLSTAGATTSDVVREQLPLLAAAGEQPALVTCSAGCNDVLRTPLPWLRRALERLAGELPAPAVLLNLPEGLRGVGTGYVARINRVVADVAERHGHGLADVAGRFGHDPADFAPDGFHPSATGYARWTEALLEALPAAPR